MCEVRDVPVNENYVNNFGHFNFNYHLRTLPKPEGRISVRK